MFFQSMIYMGFFGVWILYNIAFVVYMESLVRERTRGGRNKNFGTYLVRMYIVSIINVFIAITMVILPVIGLIVGFNPYWVLIGVIYTLGLHYYYIKMFIWGELSVSRVSGDKAEKVTENANIRIVYKILVVFTGIYYVLIAFNTFDVLPLLKAYLPPIMPMYFHILTEFTVMLGIVLLNSIILLITTKRIKSMEKLSK